MHMPKRLALCCKANITPDKEFKTEMHSIKREAAQKFIGTLTKFHYCRFHRNNDKLQRAKSDESRSKGKTDRLSISPHAQSNSCTNVLHSCTT